jgi:two-component system, NarL family, nitrate/nitrite response regulator NarL
MTTRVLLVDDHPVGREGMRQKLETVPHFCIVGEADNAADALRIAHEHSPDLAMLDIGLADMDGIELTRALCAQLPQIAVVVFTMYAADSYVVQAVRAGARGYVLKESSMSQVIAAIKAVAAGGTYFSSTIMGAVTRAEAHPPISEREWEVLRLLMKGFSNKEVARTLSLSVRTVEAHRKSLKCKLGADRSVDLGRYAVRLRGAKEV